MTQLTLIAVGKMKAGPLDDLAQLYFKRLVPGGLGPVRLVELEAKPQLIPELQKQREADAIRAKLPEAAIMCALDERGQTCSSQELSDWIGKQQVDGAQHLAFVIGGANGLDESIRKQARLVLAFGEMTWPHMLARVMLLEQLYRAQQILAGHPYHRE